MLHHTYRSSEKYRISATADVVFGPSTLLNDLVAYWKLEEASGTRFDEVGSNDLTDVNTVTQAVGKVGNAAQFTRANTEHLEIADNTDMSTGDIDFTFALWIYPDVVNVTQYAFGKWGSNGQFATLEYAFRAANTSLVFEVSSGGTNANVIVTLAVTAATWFFIVCWHDSVANTINLQIDDGTVDDTEFSDGIQDGPADFSIGRPGEFAGSPYWDGRIDEMGFWKRVLTTDERTELYNSGAGVTHPF